MMIAVDYGFGRHLLSLSKDDRLMALKVKQSPWFATKQAANIFCLFTNASVYNSYFTSLKFSTK